MKNTETILEVKDLKKYFPIRAGILRRVVNNVKAVDGVDLAVKKGEILSLVGESGCGKTTLARTLLRAIEPTGGQVLFKINENEVVDIAGADKNELKRIRKKIQMIFQDPHSSLNPRMTVKDIIGEPLVCNNISRGKELEERVKELLDQVGLQPQYMRRYPHAFSGGQRQRIGIARALAINPDIILADEPVSALDVSIQAQILNLLEEIHHEFDLTMIFISHDLSVVRYISDRIAVMYVGKIVEIGKTDEVFNNSRHPYTRALLSAVPSTDPDRKTERIMLEGDVADPATEFAGCRFADRCQYAQQRCREETPKLKGDDEHQVACFYPLQ